MIRTVLLSAMLLAVGVALVPGAAAECVPKTNVCQDWPPWLKDPRDMECYYYPETGDIRCYW